MRNRAQVFVCAFISLASWSCAGRRPEAASPPTTAPPPITVVPPDPTSVRVVFAPDARRYRVESRTVITLLADSTHTLDSISVVAEVQLQVRRDAGSDLAASGSVLRLTVTSGLGRERSVQVLDRPFMHSWSIRPGGTFAPVKPASIACGGLEQVAFEQLVALLPALPDSLVQGSSWTTNIVTTQCRDGVEVRSESAIISKVTDFAAALRGGTLTVREEGSIATAGRGSQGVTTLALSGRGSVVTDHKFNVRNGLLSSSTSSELQLTFDLGYRADRFIQRTIRTVMRID